MASARVDRVLEEIEQLSPEEQRELIQALPRVMQADIATHERLAALRQAIAVRERIRARMAADGVELGSVAEDLEEVRSGRMDDLSAPPNNEGTHA